MVDFHSEIQKLNKEIHQALEEGADATVDSLKLLKKGFEKQLQLGKLQREVYGETVNLVDTHKRYLAKQEKHFDAIYGQAKHFIGELVFCFESETGTKVAMEMEEYNRKLRKKVEPGYQEVKESCKVKLNF